MIWDVKVTNMQKRWVNRVRKGEAKSSYGTGALKLVDTSKEVIKFKLRFIV